MRTRVILPVVLWWALLACAGRRPTNPEESVLPPPPTPPVVPLPPAQEGPMTLERAVTLAFERNPSLRAAAERIEVARSRLSEAASAFYPQVAMRSSYVRTDNPAQAFGAIVAQRRFSPFLDVNDPGIVENFRSEVTGYLSLFRGGQDAAGASAAFHGLQAAAFERSALRNALGEAVVATWYAILGAREQMGAAQASIQAVEAELAEARKRFEAGALLKSDVLSLEVRLAAAREGHLRARNAVQTALEGLRTLLALELGDVLEISPDPPVGDDCPECTLSEALARALRDRPEIRAAAELAEIRRRELQSEKGAWLPRVDVFGSWGQDHDTFEWDHDQDNYAFGVVAEMDLFSGFRTKERVRAAERRLREAGFLQDKIRREIEEEVRVSLLALDEARERVRATEASSAAAEEALRLVREQYQAGTATVTRYLEAEAALADARSRSISARYDVRRAEARMKKAMGFWK